jgi:hypothetical protein
LLRGLEVLAGVKDVSFEAFIADLLIDERGPSQQPGRLLLRFPATASAQVLQLLKRRVHRRDKHRLKMDGLRKEAHEPRLQTNALPTSA